MPIRGIDADFLTPLPRLDRRDGFTRGLRPGLSSDVPAGAGVAGKVNRADAKLIGPGFCNPLLPAPSQDPWVTRHEGSFYALITDGRTIFLRRSVDARELFRQGPVAVWRAPRRGPNSKHLWAPELHRIDGRWWIYYAADNGRNRCHRVWALASAGDDPAGPYHSAGMVDTGGWSIDATLLREDGGGHTGPGWLIWSGWEGAEKGAQNLYIARLADPLTLDGERVRLTQPTEGWEQGGAAVCEGPAVLRHGETTCVVYAASASWTVHGCLGMLVNRDGDFLNPAAWTKVGPVFARTPQVWGIGHCSVVADDESGSEGGGFIFYHAKTRKRHGWRDRNVRGQRFRWNADGLPDFGSPMAVG